MYVRRWGWAACLAVLVMTASAGASSAQTSPEAVTVEVIDPQGAPVVGAVVSVADAQSDASRISLTRSNGRAAVTLEGTAATLEVRADGFGVERVDVTAAALEPVVVMLHPVGFVEQVSVTAGRRLIRGAEVPADTTILLGRDMEGLAAGTLDDALRLTPGFSLFRRNSSRSANPTTQGVTLRGLSASGASRTLVLADGVPLNDPFGGWVSWTRVPVAAIERVEVVRGGSSDLYGADAAGGVIQVVTATPSGVPSARILAEAGSQETGRLSGIASAGVASWRVGIAGELTTTEGGIPIAPEVRGPVDAPAGVDSYVASVSLLPPAFGNGWQATLRGSVHGEDRTNGTRLQDNDTNQRQASGDLQGRAGPGNLRIRGFATGQGYDQSFSAVSADRTSENVILRQQVQSSLAGGSAEYVAASRAVTWLGGVDVRRHVGDLAEHRTSGVTPADGSQTQTGVFGQATWVPTAQWMLVGGMRVDTIATETSAAGSIDQTAVSPKVSAVFAPRTDTTIRASVFRAFRAPTLNERLRSFRVGNVVTNNNPTLEPETATGMDVSLQVERRTLSGRVTGFVTQLDDAVTNVTLSRTPSLITRQRRNAGTIEARGVELEGAWRPYAPIRIGGSLTFTRSRFSDAVEPGLAGRTVPQVPGAQAAVDVRWQARNDTALTAQTRWIGEQFDDDQNAFTLNDAWIVDLLGEHRLMSQVRAFVAVENLFDADYDTGRTPERTVGLPRRVRVGVRLDLSR